ncbi:hypothetical protein HGRIS_009794 [Hohenbuehelia grisea]|uniref:WIBG Mago-binding domain-containing protein n=1 Tax=Hohenbuehelia grisea TaxID=104357 RepID=A0ABR3J284_9AGAR
MARPPLNPDKTLAGITVDPHTLERVIPESRRADGSVRKQLKIRPGFTPQEDVRRFRGSRQQQMDANALPKGHIIGWVPPTNSKPGAYAFPALGKSTSASTGEKPLSKAAKKNLKRKEKREDKRADAVKDNWDDDDDDDDDKSSAKPTSAKANDSAIANSAAKDTPPSDLSTETSVLEKELEKLNVA